MLSNLVLDIYQSSTSRFFRSYKGLKQGDPSSPLPFMLFINNIVQDINVDVDQIFTVDDM